MAIRKQGYPFRLPHEDFVDRYKKICPTKIDDASPRDAAMAIVKVCPLATLTPGTSQDHRSLTQGLHLQAVKLDESNVRVGNTRMLYRARECVNLPS